MSTTPAPLTEGITIATEGPPRGHVNTFVVFSPIYSLSMMSPELVAGVTAAAGTVSVIVKAKIDSRTEIRKAEIEAETRRLEITEETKREELRSREGRAPAEDY